ncbi:hypothetical protein SCAR479_12777 [Seiridium cardinale]|uniref:Uncharacterized protein n=1 Tax=Seiridium cardinale TaxID=138064 RepID=A0ABR2X9N9_9PEZI
MPEKVDRGSCLSRPKDNSGTSGGASGGNNGGGGGSGGGGGRSGGSATRDRGSRGNSSGGSSGGGGGGRAADSEADVVVGMDRRWYRWAERAIGTSWLEILGWQILASSTDFDRKYFIVTTAN